jgi:hypothetical protein
MLHDAGMAGLAKLRRSIRSTDERKLRAVHVGRGEIVWQDRCDAANGSKEPKLTVVPIDLDPFVGATKWSIRLSPIRPSRTASNAESEPKYYICK